MDFSLQPDTPEISAFRKDVHEWLAENMRGSENFRWSARWSTRENDEEYQFRRTLARKVGQKGWLFPTYPVRYGGAGLTLDHQFVLETEIERYGLQLSYLFYTLARLVAPAVLKFGTEEQKQDTAEVVPLAHERGIKVMALAGAVKHALSHARKGADVIISQGYEADGHTGTIANFPLIPQIVDAVKPKPVVAAGGICDGRGVAAALALGAVGVWCGTAFLVSDECGIHPAYKNQLIKGSSEDFVRTAYTSGHYARHYRGEVIRAWMGSGLEAMPTPYQGAIMDEIRRAAEAADRTDLLHVPGGQVAGMLTQERSAKPAKVILERMVDEAAQILNNLRSQYIGA